MLAMSWPVDMSLVVKEHPWMVGKRSLSSYKKMLNIPRVIFADPKLEARSLIKQAELISVITGSVAFESAILCKPVISFGDCPFNLLPDTMVKKCEDPRHLQALIKKMLSEHEHDENALEAYVSAVYESSASVNLYSDLLGKRNVHTERLSAYLEEIDKLATYLTSELLAPPTVEEVEGAAAW